jgi:hypothetical protein
MGLGFTTKQRHALQGWGQCGPPSGVQMPTCSAIYLPQLTPPFHTMPDSYRSAGAVPAIMQTPRSPLVTSAAKDSAEAHNEAPRVLLERWVRQVLSDGNTI